MAKNKLTNAPGFVSLFGANPIVEKAKKEIEESFSAQRDTQAGSKRGRPRKTDGSVKSCIVVDETLIGKVRTIAYRHNLQIKEIVNQALSIYLERYEAKNGIIENSIHSDNINDLI